MKRILLLALRAPTLPAATEVDVEWRAPFAVVPRLFDVKRKLLDLSRYRGAVFTSQNAVEVFVSVLRSLGRDARALAGLRIAAVGAQTAEALRQRLLEPDLVGHSGGVALAQEIIDAGWIGPLFFPRAAGGREELVEALTAAGIAVETTDAYDLVADEKLLGELVLRHREQPWDAIGVTSPKLAAAILERLPAGSWPLLGAIGETTRAAILERGAATVVMPPHPDVAALVEALSQTLSGTSKIE